MTADADEPSRNHPLGLPSDAGGHLHTPLNNSGGLKPFRAVFLCVGVIVVVAVSPLAFSILLALFGFMRSLTPGALSIVSFVFGSSAAGFTVFRVLVFAFPDSYRQRLVFVFFAAVYAGVGTMVLCGMLQGLAFKGVPPEHRPLPLIKFG
ncbi:MAG: hypothetical protein AAGJ97_02950 [Planctomycetota bacterium]